MWSDGQVVRCQDVRLSSGQVARRSGGQVVRWSGGQVSGGQVSGGQVVRWSGGQEVMLLCGQMVLIQIANLTRDILLSCPKLTVLKTLFDRW